MSQSARLCLEYLAPSSLWQKQKDGGSTSVFDYLSPEATLVAQLVKICLQCERPGFDPWVGKIPWRREWSYSLQYSGLENPMDCIVHAVAKSQTRLSDLHKGFPGGGSGKEPTRRCRRCKRHGFDSWVRKIPRRRDGNPLQYSCLENPMDIGAWQATVHRVTQNRTQLKRLNTHTQQVSLLLKVYWPEVITWPNPTARELDFPLTLGNVKGNMDTGGVPTAISHMKFKNSPNII